MGFEHLFDVAHGDSFRGARSRFRRRQGIAAASANGLKSEIRDERYFQSPNARNCEVTTPAQSLFEAGQAGLGWRIWPICGEESASASRARLVAKSPTPITHRGLRISTTPRRCSSHAK